MNLFAELLKNMKNVPASNIGSIRERAYFWLDVLSRADTVLNKYLHLACLQMNKKKSLPSNLAVFL